MSKMSSSGKIKKSSRRRKVRMTSSELVPATKSSRRRKVRMTSSEVVPSNLSLKAIFHRVKRTLMKRRTRRQWARIAAYGMIASAFAGSSAVAFGGLPGGGTPNPPDEVVPEIAALEGTAALAVVAAMILLAFERRRRQA